MASPDDEIKQVRWYLLEANRWLAGALNNCEEEPLYWKRCYEEISRMADQLDPPGDCFPAKVIPFAPRRA